MRNTREPISVEMDVDESIIPGPHQRPFEPFPPWWIDNPLRLVERVTDYYVQVGAERALGDRIVRQRPSQPVAVDLVDAAGAVVRTARPTPSGGLGAGHTGSGAGGILGTRHEDIDDRRCRGRKESLEPSIGAASRVIAGWRVRPSSCLAIRTTCIVDLMTGVGGRTPRWRRGD